MMTLDDALRQAADALQAEVAQMPDKIWYPPIRRRPHGLFVAAGVAAVLLVAFGVPSLLLNTTRRLPAGFDTTSPVATTATPAVSSSATMAVDSSLDLPTVIAAGMDPFGLAVLTQDGRRLTSSQSESNEGLRYESAVYSNGRGLVELTWQDWPESVDFHSALGDDTTVEQSDGFELTLRAHPEDNTIEIGVFDGRIYARAYTTFTDDLNASVLRGLAFMLYDGLTATEAVSGGEVPSPVRDMLNPGETPMTWGISAGAPWVLVAWHLVVSDKPTSACTGVRPVVDEDWCTGLDDSSDWIYAQAFAVGDGGVVVLRTKPGVAQVRIDSTKGSQLVTVLGESDGYPPTAVIDANGLPISATMTPLDVNGDKLGDSLPLKVDIYPKTPLGG
ncbi:MAG: hypothetical protein WA726_03220 [Acidimicrobiia bacterium]